MLGSFSADFRPSQECCESAQERIPSKGEQNLEETHHFVFPTRCLRVSETFANCSKIFARIRIILEASRKPWQRRMYIARLMLLICFSLVIVNHPFRGFFDGWPVTVFLTMSTLQDLHRVHLSTSGLYCWGQSGIGIWHPKLLVVQQQWSSFDLPPKTKIPYIWSTSPHKNTQHILGTNPPRKI